MYRVLLLFVIVIATSCTNIRDTKISAPNSHKVLSKICHKLDSSSAKSLKYRYRLILMAYEDLETRKNIIKLYGIRYEDITFQDLIEHKNISKLKK
ncbi:hypothetical protein SAMN05660703_0270 [Cellulophaga tyrosinoxydans]|uniref:Lipoprotein n=1 Tax=Cellulophaga tyrosinoxydans TaxID=504486 RepID=A0A1W1YC01_9FLAO|nr:hypothetical protein SAMN05660703_0270 [Cellulophaga tyrosinoxydans]